MASKIFMGNMPELMEKILENLNNEVSSLHSCALVSRYWCKMSIPLLWQDPFSFSRMSSFISNYFSSLCEDEKFFLKKRVINVEISKTLFDYARFLKVINYYHLASKVYIWVSTHRISTKKDIFLIYHIFNLLFKIFIESGATLHKLVLNFSEDIDIKPEIFYLIERNEQFFSKLQDLFVCSDNIENHTKLLRLLAKHATKLSVLEFEELNLIINPKRFNILGGAVADEFHGIISALKSQKQSLREVKIEYCEYNYKISTLEIIDYLIEAKPIESFLKKSGTLLQRLKIESDYVWEEETLLLNAIKLFCPNLKYLSIIFILFSTELLELIGSLQKLQFLTLRLRDDGMSEEKSEIRYKEFVEILPITLQYLDLTNTRQNPRLDVWLNNCSSPLKRLLIDSLDNEKQAQALIEFYKRKRTLNCVGVSKYSELNDNIKKEVEMYVTLVFSESIVIDC
ncbi:hypothetical protein C2G38_2247853 [Gigaspora rosea]|uniref:F-box domain-containing protein n=1 Tax=Gigaspora rosea TaxID=44941 RepID=A0A397UY86_9GLOM|nr:hypothetical protein C2G38_2247853 [Gigaspora rosea]